MEESGREVAVREIANRVLKANEMLNEAISIAHSEMGESFFRGFRAQGGKSLGAVHFMLKQLAEESPECLPAEFRELFRR